MFGFATSTLAVFVGLLVTPAPQWHVTVQVFRGDPLGSTEDKSIEVINQPEMTLANKQVGTFESFQQATLDSGITVPTGLWLELALTATAGGVNLAFSSKLQHVSSGRWHSWKGNAVLVMKPGREYKVRLAAESPTDQLWAVVTVVPYQQ